MQLVNCLIYLFPDYNLNELNELNAFNSLLIELYKI